MAISTGSIAPFASETGHGPEIARPPGQWCNGLLHKFQTRPRLGKDAAEILRQAVYYLGALPVLGLPGRMDTAFEIGQPA